jgi:hypothetical protein
MKKVVVLLTAMLVSISAMATDVTLSWEAVTHDVNGNQIDPQYLEYIPYMKFENDDWVSQANGLTALEYQILSVAPGCYEFAVTAYRTDSAMESEPSAIIARCFDGDEGNVAVPMAPQGFIASIIDVIVSAFRSLFD